MQEHGVHTASYRRGLSLLCLPTLAFFLIGCHAYKNTDLEVSPASASIGAAGSTMQFKALEIATDAGHPSKTTDVTKTVTWSSGDTGVATISASGLATATGSGTTTITASTNGSYGVVTGTASLTAQGHDLLSLVIVPSSQTLYAVGETAQFVAVGTFDSAPITQDMTDQVTWISTDVNLATINSSGLATAVSCPPAPAQVCNTSITASAISSGGSQVDSLPAALTLNLNPGGGSNLPSLTIYKVGLGTGTVTGIAGSGINCGTSCTANFVLNASVTLTATPDAGSVFGGWSANCILPTATTCTVSMGNSETVGAIFNQN
jgi:hypothetical protein